MPVVVVDRILGQARLSSVGARTPWMVAMTWSRKKQDSDQRLVVQILLARSHEPAAHLFRHESSIDVVIVAQLFRFIEGSGFQRMASQSCQTSQWSAWLSR